MLRRTGFSNIWLTFTLAATIWLLAGPCAAQTPPPLRFKLTPDTIQAGNIREVKITSEPNADLTGFELLSPPDPLISFEEVNKTLFRLTQDKTAILVQVKVDQDAEPQSLNLVLQKKQSGNVTATYTVPLIITEFKPRPIRRQAVPPDIKPSDPIVDAQFQPLSYKATHDVFGRRVADTYYAVAVSLGNNTGFDLQITKLGFITNIPVDVLDVDKDGRPICPYKQPICKDEELLKRKEFLQIAAIDRILVRSTIEKDQNFGKRALALNLIGGVGTLTSGFLPFFKAVGPRANFASFSSILNGQLKEGFTLAVPDLTIRQLNRLENDIVMHDDFILQNNSEKNTVIFVPRSVLNLKEYGINKKDERDNLMLVKNMLGRLVIVGRQVERYANREIVVRTGASGEDASLERAAAGRQGGRESDAAPSLFPDSAATPSVTGISPMGGIITKQTEVKITGGNFADGVAVNFGDTPGFVKSVTPTEITVIPPARPAGTVKVEVVNPNGQKAVSPKDYTYFTELLVIGFDRPSGSIVGGETVKIFGLGFRSDTKVIFDGKELSADSVQVVDDKTIAIKTPQHAAGTVKVSVVNPPPYPSQEGKELTFTFNP